MNPHANLLLVCATQVESRAILEVFRGVSSRAPEPTPIADRMYHNLGLINNTTVFMMQCEMGTAGPGASLLTVAKGINALSPEAVIMVGLAFGLNSKKQSIGEVLVSKQLMLYDLQRVGTVDGSTKPNLVPRGDRPHASSWLLDRFRSAETYWEGRFPVSFGLILSGEKLVDNVDFRQQLKDFEPEAIGGEMEGAGLYAACQDAKTDWILVKSICDWADGHKNRKKSENQWRAAQNAAAFVVQVLQQAPLKREPSMTLIVSPASLDFNSRTAQVTLILDVSLTEFTSASQRQWISELSRILSVDPDRIRLLRVAQGSTVITLEMPEAATKALTSLYSQQSTALRSLRIRKIEAADLAQVASLMRGADTWNTWRAANTDAKIVLNQANLNGLELERAILVDADLRWASLAGTHLRGANLSRADLGGANLHQAELIEVNLESSSLVQAGLSMANLRDANLGWANLSGADLTGADLSGANLSGAVLSGANLSRAILRRTTFSKALLEGSNVTGASFGNTVFAFTDLGKVVGLDTVEHIEPSSIGLETIGKSMGKIPRSFLRACGFSDVEVAAASLFDPDLNDEHLTGILSELYDLLARQALQVSPLFISYSQADAAFVDKLEVTLTKKGIRFWRDTHDTVAGRLDRQIDRAIRLNPTVLLVLSEHSLRSDWVEHEVRTARGLEKEFGRDVLCPVALDDSWKSASWPRQLMAQIIEYNILDFSAWRDDAKFDGMFRKLIDGLELFYKG